MGNIERFYLDVDSETFKSLNRKTASHVFYPTPWVRQTLLTPQNFDRVRFEYKTRFVEFEYEGSENLGEKVKIHLGDFKLKH
jgi:hypothetical protein